MQIPTGIRIKENSWSARVAAWKLKGHAAALVFGNTIHLYHISREAFLQDEAWLKHELLHVAQYRALGKTRFLCAYLAEWIKNGYRNNKFEIAAREAERMDIAAVLAMVSHKKSYHGNRDSL